MVYVMVCILDGSLLYVLSIDISGHVHLQLVSLLHIL